MADTQRTLAELLLLYPDNTAGMISPQDGRDLIETLRPNVGLIHATAPGVTTITDTVSFFDANATFALIGLSDGFDLQATGRLRYIGNSPRKVLASVVVSISAAGVNQELHFRIAKNGVGIDESEQHRVMGGNGDVGNASLVADVILANNEYICVQVRNATAAIDVTFAEINIRGVAHVT